MRQNVTDLNPKQLEALELYMAGKTTGNIAAQLGISRQTVWRWHQLPAFAQLREELEWHRREDLREQASEVMRLCLASFMRELSEVENERYRNPLDAAINIFRIMKPMQPTQMTQTNIDVSVSANRAE